MDKNTLIQTNKDVIQKKDYESYHVAKYDKNFKLIGFYKNRNQAVIHYFRSKGYSDSNSIIAKYLQWNRALRNAMESGGIWHGYYYVYVIANDTRAFLFEGNTMHRGTGKARQPIILVNKNGKEKNYNSICEIAREWQIPPVNLQWYIDSGRIHPLKKCYLFRKGKRKYFNSVNQIIKHYHIGKSITKKDIKEKNRIRGQIVLFK